MDAVDTSTKGAALAAQGLALLALIAALLGAAWLDARGGPRVLVLIDRSYSVPREQAEQAAARVVQAAHAIAGAELQRLEFAGQPGVPGGEGGAALAPAATDIERALQAALAAHARTPLDTAVVISDGLATAGDTARALRAAREAGLPVRWVPVGSPAPQTWIDNVLAPDRAMAGQRIQLGVQLAGRRDRPLRVKAIARNATGQTQQTSADAAGGGPVSLEFDAGHGGAVRVDLSLEDVSSARAVDALPDAVVVDVVPKAPILYAQASTGALARSLLRGDWALEVIPVGQLDALGDGLDGYRAVILDDVSVSDASPRFWNALTNAVQQRGLGLLVLGGERSFARGGYQGSVLESVLPLLSEPPTPDQADSVIFAVDKSGSMGQGSGGVDRFQLAQRAVVEAARGLGERDALGLLVFDVAPQLLLPLGPARAALPALERAWPATPKGGTRLGPALDAAIGELERAGSGRRLLVMVTDGAVDEAPLAGLRARLDRARVETIWIAVGPEADLGALEHVIGSQTGLVLRAGQAADLPLTLRTALERRRSRVERDPAAVVQRAQLPFAPGNFPDWPPVAAHAVTRPRPGAVVAVQSELGDPLIAFQSFGAGRAIALSCGLGRWTPEWTVWREWPRLAGGLADWIVGAPSGGAAALTVVDGPGAPQVLAEVGAGVDKVAIDLITPAGRRQTVSMEAVAAGRWRGELPDAGPGLYTLSWSTPVGGRRQLYLRRQPAEGERRGLEPALGAWLAAGLIGTWDPKELARRAEAATGTRPVDRSLLGLALALFVAGVCIERWRTLRERTSVLRRRPGRRREPIAGAADPARREGHRG